MPKVTTEEFVEKWGRRLKGSTEDMIRGADKVTVAPSSLAIAKKAKMKAKLIKAIDDGTWERMLGAYTLEQWKTDFKETGIGRVSSGVDKAETKMTKFGAWLLPRVGEVQAMIDKMPDVTLEDSVSRATKYIREMAKKKYKSGK